MKKIMMILLLLPMLWGCNDQEQTIDTSKQASIQQLDMKQLQEKLDADDTFILLVTQSNCSYCKNLKNTMKPILSEHTGLPIFELEIDMLGTKKADINENLKRLKQTVAEYGGSTPELFFYKQGKLKQKANGDMSETAFRNFLIDCGLLTGEKKSDEAAMKLTMNQQMKEIGFLELSELLAENDDFYIYLAENDRYNVMFSEKLAELTEEKKLEIQLLNLSTQPQPKTEAEYEAIAKSMEDAQNILSDYQYSPCIFHIKDKVAVDVIIDNVSKKALQEWFDKQ